MKIVETCSCGASIQVDQPGNVDGIRCVAIVRSWRVDHRVDCPPLPEPLAEPLAVEVARRIDPLPATRPDFPDSGWRTPRSGSTGDPMPRDPRTVNLHPSDPHTGAGS